jgi:hypothetical protein
MGSEAESSPSSAHTTAESSALTDMAIRATPKNESTNRPVHSPQYNILRLTMRRVVRRETPATDRGVKGLPMMSMNREATPPEAGSWPSRTLTL